MTYNLVLLDDEPADVTRVERMLEPFESFKVNSFTNIESAIGYLAESSGDVEACVVDYCLGKDTAFDFIAKLRKQNIPLLPIVVITGQTDINIDVKLMESGVFDYCSKDDLNAEILERSLRYAIKRYREYAVKSKEALEGMRNLAYVNHELKTPLNGIIGCTSMLSHIWSKLPVEHFDQNSVERADLCLDIIARSGERLKVLISQLLELSEVNMATGSIKREAADLNQLVEEAYQTHIQTADSDGLFYKLHKNQKPVIVHGDHNKLLQIVSNLISNAIKYTQEGGVDVYVSEVSKDSSCYAQLTVTDSGIGIDEKDKELIFKEFYKVHEVDDTFKKQVNSNGLGLAITKRLVEQHGGQILVESEKGKGSKFIVQFPVRQKELEENK